MPEITTHKLSEILARCAARQATNIEHLLLNEILNNAFLEESFFSKKLALKLHVTSIKAKEQIVYKFPDTFPGIEIELDCDIHIMPKAGVSRQQYLQDYIAGKKTPFAINEMRFAVIASNTVPVDIIEDDKVIGTKVALQHIITPSQDEETDLLHVDSVANLENAQPVYLETYPAINNTPALREQLAERARGYLDDTGFYINSQKPIIDDAQIREAECEALLISSGELVVFTDNNPAEVKAQYVPKLNERDINVVKLHFIEQALKDIDSRFFHSNGLGTTETNTFKLVKQLMRNQALSPAEKLKNYYKIFERSATQGVVLSTVARRDVFMQNIACAVREVIEDKAENLTFPQYRADGEPRDPIINQPVNELYNITAILLNEQTQRAEKLKKKNDSSLSKNQIRCIALLKTERVTVTFSELYDAIDLFLEENHKKAQPAEENDAAQHNDVLAKPQAIKGNRVINEISAIMHLYERPTMQDKVQAIRQVFKICRKQARYKDSLCAFFLPAKMDAVSQHVINSIAKAEDIFTATVLNTKITIAQAAEKVAIDLQPFIRNVRNPEPELPQSVAPSKK